MKRITLFILPLLVIVLAAGAYAQHRPAPNGGPGGPGFAGAAFGGPGGSTALAEYLGLTAEQKTAWETIQSDTRAAIEALHEQERTLHEQLRTALDGGSTDAAAFGNLLIQIRSIDAQIKAARDAADAKFEATLTADQKVKFAAFQAASAFLHQGGPGGRH
jgi:Spy/CpxP family protein refolding chaperone